MLCTIQTFLQLAENVACTNDKTLELLHVHVGINISIKEHIADINAKTVK